MAINAWCSGLRHVSLSHLDQDIGVAVRRIFGKKDIETIDVATLPDEAVRCNRDGEASSKGQFYRIPTGETKTIKYREHTYSFQRLSKDFSIWKIYKGRKKTNKIKQHDYDKAQEKPYDLEDPKVRKRFERILNRMFAELGISYANSSGIVTLSNKIDTACWAYSERTKKETILMNPYMLAGGVQNAMRVFKHEVLHRAHYRKVGHDKANKQVVNIVLDVCINRLLSDLGGKINKDHVNWCRWIYPDEAKAQAVSLCDASLTHDQRNALPNQVRKLWLDLYQTNKDGVFEGRFSLKDLNPNNMYWLMKRFFKIIDLYCPMGGGVNPFGHGGVEMDEDFTPRSEEVGSLPAANSKIAEEAVRKHTIKEIDKKRNQEDNKGKKAYNRYNRSYSDIVSSYFEEWTVDPEKMEDKGLADFAKMMQTQKAIEDVEGHILQFLEDKSVLKPEPRNLTNKGMIMVACGYEGEEYPFFHCMDTGQRSKKAAAFFDVSPSMIPFISYMVGIIDTVKDECEVDFASNGLHSFAGSVAQMSEEDFEDFKKGKLKTGSSTCFNEVVKWANDKIETDDLDMIMIFTDGESGVSQKEIDRFNDSGKSCFTIYFSGYPYGSDKIESQLDQLNGASFTLKVEPKENNG